MIQFFPNKMADSAPMATYRTDRRMTLEQWLIEQSPSYQRLESPPISIILNDEIIESRLWHKVQFKPSDQVDIYREPKGTDPFSITYALFAGAKAVMKMMAPKMPGMPSNPTAQGNPLDDASAKGNKVKLGDTIREIAGRQRTFPSYLAEPRHYFAGPREQWVEMLLYVGWGSYDIPVNTIKVGGTPLVSLGADATWSIYQPGEDLSNDPASMLWCNVKEVGASSSGSAGLDLTVTTDLARSATASAYRFAGDAISIPAGAGSFPDNWDAGLIIRVVSPYEYTVIDGGAGRDIVQGPLEMLNPTVGMEIEVAGTNAGNYIVNSYSPYSPEVPPSAGTASTILGSSAPARYDFDVTPLTFTISRGATPYSVTLSTAASDLAGLVSAFNTAKGAAPFIASASSGVLLITEASTFTGLPLVSSDASEILGTSPTGSTGSAATSGSPEQPAQMTLDYEGGSPVNGLAIGTGLASIGPRGLRYRITAFGASTITLDRLTSSGAVDAAWPGFNVTETVSGVISLDQSNLQGGYRGPFAVCDEGEKVTEIEWTVEGNKGIFGLGREGQIYQVSSFHTLEYRDMELAGAWTVIDKTHSSGSMDAVGFTNRVTLPYPMRPEVQLKKRFIQQGERENETNNDITWTALRGLRQTRPTSYPGMTVISLRVRGGDRLSAQSESNIGLEATRILPMRSVGAWQPAQPTRDIVPFVLNVLKTLGYTDTDINLPEFDLLHEECHAAGQFYDQSIDDTLTAKEVINNALACGWAELTIANGKIKPVRDVPRAVFEREYGPKTQTYSPQNMTKSLVISGPLNSINDYDGVDVEYFSSVSWSWETVECRWPGDQGIKVEKLKLPGVSDKDRAYQWGMRRRGHQLFRQDTYSWSTELDGRNSGYLSFCAVASDTPGLCQSAILLGVETVPEGVVLESSEPLDWSAGGNHKVGIRRLDGTLSGPYQASQIDEFRVRVDELDFDPATDSVDLEPPHLLFGPSDKWAYPVLVTSADPSNGGVAMKGMPYDSRVYTYDNATAPEAA
ncbi:host specificity factor TipJ family phage tail protein [Pseudomonas paraversuta]|uniref:host specificity factor TipJ family phage tail protein n=1 Tax=Pseudomonas paraversuta TaxID=2750624 RepID=UPI0019316A20|nr:host specificity factor TipJ family phage tail protein [Pseudomonas paraversuta]